jgi:Histidine kinase-like ATPase domain
MHDLRSKIAERRTTRLATMTTPPGFAMNFPPPSETTGIPLNDQGWDDWLRPFADSPRSNGDQPLVASRDLPPEVESPGIARNVTKATLVRWSLGEFYDDAAVVVSELVTNAIRYGLRPGAGYPLRLVLVRYERQLVCMVTDPTDAAPAMREPDWVAETGRGLHIIEAISRAWGWTPLLQGGKAVWASFSII